MKIRLFIEGSSDRSNGDLRQGFRKLLEPLLPGVRFQIIMGGGKAQAIHKFKKAKEGGCLLLIDLDAPQTDKDQDLEAYDLTGTSLLNGLQPYTRKASCQEQLAVFSPAYASAQPSNLCLAPLTPPPQSTSQRQLPGSPPHRTPDYH